MKLSALKSLYSQYQSERNSVVNRLFVKSTFIGDLKVFLEDPARVDVSPDRDISSQELFDLLILTFKYYGNRAPSPELGCVVNGIWNELNPVNFPIFQKLYAFKDFAQNSLLTFERFHLFQELSLDQAQRFYFDVFFELVYQWERQSIAHDTCLLIINAIFKNPQTVVYAQDIVNNALLLKESGILTHLNLDLLCRDENLPNISAKTNELIQRVLQREIEPEDFRPQRCPETSPLPLLLHPKVLRSP